MLEWILKHPLFFVACLENGQHTFRKGQIGQKAKKAVCKSRDFFKGQGGDQWVPRKK